MNEPISTVDRRALLKLIGAGGGAAGGLGTLGTRMSGVKGEQSVASGRTVYIGSGDTTLYAVDAATGDQQWAFTGSSRTIRGSPTAVNGTVYFGSWDQTLYAVDAATGEQEWAFTDPSHMRSSPTVVGGIVYIGSRDQTVWAVDAATGEQEWAFTEPADEVQTSPAVVDGTVYVGSHDETLYAVDAATGEQEWAFTEPSNTVQTSPAVVDGTVYVGSDGGNLYAVDSTTGEQEWVFTEPSSWIWSAPTVVDGTVYVGAVDETLYAVDAATGEQEWAFTEPTGSINSSPTVVDGTVYVGSIDDTLYAVDADTGNQEWAFTEPTNRVSSAPTVLDGTVYVGSHDETLYAVDAATGDQVWAFTEPSEQIESSPTVVDDPENGNSIGSRVLLGTLGHHDERRTTFVTPLSLEGPADPSLVGGVESSFLLEIENATSDPLSEIDLTSDSPDDPVTLSVADAPETLEPEESATATLTVEAASDWDQPITVELTADADEVDPVTETVTFDVQDPAEVCIVSAGSADRAFVDNAAKFTFEVVTNDIVPIEDVELIPRFDRLPGEWTVHEPELNPDAYRHSVGRWLGGSPPDGDGTDDEFLNVWNAPELAPGMVEQPSIELTVPEDVSPGEHTLPVEVYASMGSGGVTELVDTTEHQFEVDTQYTFLSVDAPDEPIVDQDQTTIDVTISALRGDIEEPEFAFETFPDEFEVVDGEASDDGFLSFSDRDVEWGGSFSEGDTLEAEFVVDLPSGEGVGGNYPIGGEATVSVPELDGERRQRSNRDVVTISDLVGQLTEKEGLAADIDDFGQFIDDHQRVQPQLDAISEAVDDGSLGAEDASAGVDRMWQGERVIERSLELTAGKQPRQVGDRSYELIRPFAEDIADLVIHVAMLPASMAFRAGRLAGVAGARVLRESGQQGLKTIRRTADEMVRIRQIRARRQQRQVENPLEPLNEFFKEVTQEWVEGRIGIDDVRARLAEPLVSRIETHMRESYQLSADAQLEELHDAIPADDLTGGPPGTAQGASGAFWTGTQGMQWRAQRGFELTNEFNEGLTSTLGDMRETLAEAEASLDSGFRTFVKLSQEILDLFLTFLTGGLASAMIGRNALVTIDDAREKGIGGIAAGEDIGDSI